jgi:hypothetical protein
VRHPLTDITTTPKRQISRSLAHSTAGGMQRALDPGVGSTFVRERTEQEGSTMGARHEASHPSRELAKCLRERARFVSIGCLVAVALAGGALSGCAATMMAQSGLGSPHTGTPEEVLHYDWADRRGDEVVVAYTVQADRAEQPRWVVLDLRQLGRTPSGAAPAGMLRPAAGPRPDPASMDAVPLIPRAAGAGTRETIFAVIAQMYPLALQVQAGREPELRLVALDPTAPGGVRVTTWQIELGWAPAPLEPVGRGLSRAILVPAALAVDLVTAPPQLIFFSFVGMH